MIQIGSGSLKQLEVVHWKVSVLKLSLSVPYICESIRDKYWYAELLKNKNCRSEYEKHMYPLCCRGMGSYCML